MTESVNDQIATLAASEPWMFEIDFDWRSVSDDDMDSAFELYKYVHQLGRRNISNVVLAELRASIHSEIERRNLANPELVEPKPLSVPVAATNKELVEAARIMLRVAELPMRHTVGNLADCYLKAIIEAMGMRLTLPDYLRENL